MSRIGNKPISVPSGVDVTLANGKVAVKGKHGELEFEYHPNMQVTYDDGERIVRVNRPNDQRQNRALHGLTRALINNMVVGVVTPFEKKLEIIGVGYQAQLDGNMLNLSVGFANTVRLPVPPEVEIKLTDPTHIVLSSCNKQVVGQFAAEIRRVRPPEPYKGKGIRYLGEHIRRKAGKAFGSG